MLFLNVLGNYGTEDFFVEHHHMVTGGKDRIMKITAFYEGSCVSTASNTLSGRVDCIR